MQEPISHPSQSKLLKTGWIEIYSVYQVTSIRFPHADDTQIVYHSQRILGDPSLRGRRLKGKGKGVFTGQRETRGAREEGGRETPARKPLFFSFLTSTRPMLKS